MATDTLTTRQAAAVFKRSRETMTDYCQRGLVPGAVKRGGRWRIPADVDGIQWGQFEVRAMFAPLSEAIAGVNGC